jgi:hypothetical protein
MWKRKTIVVYDGSPRRIDPLAPGRSAVHRPRGTLPRSASHGHSIFPPGMPAIVPSDDDDPIDVFDVRLRERVRRNLLKSTDCDVLIDDG